MFCTFWLRNTLRATAACTFSTAQLPSAPSMRCFVHFDFEVCFVPQRRALFWTSKLPKVVWHAGVNSNNTSKCASHHNGVRFFYIPTANNCSGCGVLLTFWLSTLLRATTACKFWSLIWPDGSAPAALASLLFDPSEAPNIGETQRFATFLPFRAPASSFFRLFLFSDLLSSSLLWLLPPLLFHLSIYCRKFDF